MTEFACSTSLVFARSPVIATGLHAFCASQSCEVTPDRTRSTQKPPKKPRSDVGPAVHWSVQPGDRWFRCKRPHFRGVPLAHGCACPRFPPRNVRTIWQTEARSQTASRTWQIKAGSWRQSGSPQMRPIRRQWCGMLEVGPLASHRMAYSARLGAPVEMTLQAR